MLKYKVVGVLTVVFVLLVPIFLFFVSVLIEQ